MGAKLWELKDQGQKRRFIFECPGCGYGHPFDVPPWTWNGSMDAPTFTPSLLCNGSDPASRCHLFITNGRVQFLSDCWHTLAGQTVNMLDVSKFEGNAQKEKKMAKKKAKKKAKKAQALAANPSAVDSRGRQFDPAIHAAHADGKPHMDSTGAFIHKDSHFNAPAQHHYGDTYRHEK